MKKTFFKFLPKFLKSKERKNKEWLDDLQKTFNEALAKEAPESLRESARKRNEEANKYRKERLKELQDNGEPYCQEIKNQNITYVGSICSNCKKPFETDTGQGETVCIHCGAEYIGDIEL